MWKHLSTAIGVRYAPPYNTLLELGIPLFPSRAESCDFAVEVLSRSSRLNEQQMTLFWQAARLVDADLQELSHEMWLEMCANLGGGGDEIDALSLDRLMSEWHPRFCVEVVSRLWTVDYLRVTYLRVDAYAVCEDASTEGSSDRSCQGTLGTSRMDILRAKNKLWDDRRLSARQVEPKCDQEMPRI